MSDKKDYKCYKCGESDPEKTCTTLPYKAYTKNLHRCNPKFSQYYSKVDSNIGGSCDCRTGKFTQIPLSLINWHSKYYLDQSDPP